MADDKVKANCTLWEDPCLFSTFYPSAYCRRESLVLLDFFFLNQDKNYVASVVEVEGGFKVLGL